MIVSMTRLQIVGHKRDLDATLRALQELACVQLVDAPGIHATLRPYASGAEHAEMETLSYLQARLDALLALLPAQPAEPEQPSTDGFLKSSEQTLAAWLQADLDTHAAALETLAQQRQTLRNDADVLPNYAATLTKLSRLTPALTELSDYETVALLINRRYAAVVDLLAEEMRAIAGERSLLVSDLVDADNIGALLVFPRAAAASMQALLGRAQVSQVSLPDSLRNVPFRDALDHIQNRLKSIPGELAAIDAQLAAAAQLHRSRWLAARQALVRRLEQLRVRSHLGETEHTFVLVGWTPQRDLPKTLAYLDQHLPDSALAVQELPPASDEIHAAPILMESHALTRPYEFFLRLFSLPEYGSFDPTALMALFMPLFFGIMLGDVGYSLVLLAISFYGLRRFSAGTGLHDIFRFLLMGSAWGVVWGLVFGEFLGSLGHDWFGMQALWRERSDPKALAPLLLFTIGLGAVHVTLGLALGVWEAWRARQSQHLWERGGMLVGLIGLFLLAAVATRRLPSGWMTPSLAVVIVGLVLLIRGLGPIGALMAPVELLGVLGNVLSYLRLAAIGLASVYLAMVGNTMAGRVGSLWVGVLIAALFHALNIALGAFSPTIHALRLHYVEFFSKFYEPGGEPFAPYGTAHS